MSVLGHVLSTWSEWTKTTSPAVQNMPKHIHLSFISELTSRVPQGGYRELSLVGSKNEWARTDTIFLAISEVCDGTVSLRSKALSVEEYKFSKCCSKKCNIAIIWLHDKKKYLFSTQECKFNFCFHWSLSSSNFWLCLLETQVPSKILACSFLVDAHELNILQYHLTYCRKCNWAGQ